MIPFEGMENRADIASLRPGHKVLIKDEHDLIIIGYFKAEIDGYLALGMCYVIPGYNDIKPCVVDLEQRMRVSKYTTQVWDLEKDIPTDEKLFLRAIIAESVPRSVDQRYTVNFILDTLPPSIIENLPL